jgi:alkylation response protein AidB-like acyl-CoA dehydrogenase
MTAALTGARAGETAVSELERLFGDATGPGNPVGSAAILAADERREALVEGERLLDRSGFNAHGVPVELGGRFDRLDGLVEVMRTVYRRDPALGLGYGAGSFMAAVNVWMAGGPEQRAGLAALLMRGGRVARALREPAAGGDSAGGDPAGEDSARDDSGPTELSAFAAPDDRGRLLNGRVDMVVNPENADAMVVIARTGAAPGDRSHSQFLLDSRRLRGADVRHLGRVHTSGMRGVRLGAVAFADCPIPDGAVIGAPGAGLRTALRSSQLTRIALAGMTVGLLDTALRTAVRCVAGRRLYGGTAADLPLTRTVLAEAFADLMLADAFTTVAARTAHTAPGAAGTYAAAVNALVPRALMGAVDRLSGLLGSQFYLRAGTHAIFQKLLRDALPAGSEPAARISGLADLLPRLPLAARGGWRGPDAEPLAEESFRLGGDLPRLRYDALSVTASGSDPLARSLAVDVDRLRPVRGDRLERAVASRARAGVDDLARLATDCSVLPPEHLTPAAPAHVFDLAERWAGLLAAAACLGLWRRNGEGGEGGESGDLIGDPVWVLAALHRLDAHLGRHRDPLPEDLATPLYTELVRREDAGLTFDLARHPTGA